MKNPIYLLALALALYSCSSSDSSSESESAADVEEEIPVATSVENAIEENDASTAYELLTNNEFSEGKLELSEDVILWYKNDPNFFSWFVSKSKIQEGPSYYYLTELVLKDLTSEVPGNELLIYAGHTPYTYIDAYSIAPSQDILAEKILETELDGSRPDEVISVDPAPDEPNLGVTSKFKIKNDTYNILTLDPASEGAESGQNVEGWEYLLNKRWYVLLKDSVDGKRKYIEPACLSTTALLEFSGEGTIEKLNIGAGQDMLEYVVRSIQNSEAGLSIKFSRTSEGKSQGLTITPSEVMADSERDLISVESKDINELLLGYYPENIVELNKQALEYIADENELMSYLRENNLLDKLPCEEEEEC